MNKVILQGNIGKNPETKIVGENQVTNFSLATSESYKDKSGEWQSNTEWHNIVCGGNTSKSIDQKAFKGTPVLIEGKICTRSWEDSSGNKRYITEIIASKIKVFSAVQNQINENDLDSDDIPY